MHSIAHQIQRVPGGFRIRERHGLKYLGDVILVLRLRGVHVLFSVSLFLFEIHFPVDELHVRLFNFKVFGFQF